MDEIFALKLLATASPEASSFAELILRPDESRFSDSATLSLEILKCL
jgi:hypothetical protein